MAVLMPFSVDHDYIESESVVFPEGKVPKMLPEFKMRPIDDHIDAYQFSEC